MISPVIICGDKSEAAGRTRQGTIASAQPCATRDSAQIKFTEHVGQGVFALSAICAEGGAYVRAVGILGSLETETVAPQIQRPAPNFKSALGNAFADTGGLRGFLPSFRLRFNSFHCGRQAARLLEEAKTVQAVEPDDDVAAIQSEIEALVARLAAAKGKAERAVK